VRFHHRFVEPHLALLDREDPRDVWTTHVAPRFASFVGLAFERVTAQAYDRLRRAPPSSSAGAAGRVGTATVRRSRSTSWRP
jgi:hypothetical protein